MTDRMKVGVLVERRRLENPWADESWLPHAVLPASPALPIGAIVEEQEKSTILFAGEAEIEIHAGGTGHYRDNMVSGRPAVWVSLRPSSGGAIAWMIAAVTVDPYEGEALATLESEIVEAVAMPATIVGWLDEYVRAHHVERPFVKRKRDRTGQREAGGPASPRR